ncbi:MAG: DNA repair protein RecN [Alphaproteobacteria bacterium]|nr:DNA repair protein RecN [Alphaproteobacteria bacterium]
MLASLDIQNVVLIDRLSLEGDAGLVALTGETGAGKSILLDALGLALGARADAGLVRQGTAQATVTASFELPALHPLRGWLADNGIDGGELIILRRSVGKDGRSKAFVNDAAVSVQFLRDVGAQLIEIHGQFDTHGLLDSATHADTLDQFTGTAADAKGVAAAWAGWRAALARLDEARAGIDAMRLQEEYLRYTVAELEKLAPQTGEEAVLAEKRQRLLNRDKLAEGLAQASGIIIDDGGLQSLGGRLENVLVKLSAKAETALAPLLETLGRIRADLEDLGWQIDRLAQADEDGSDSLEDIEERYFALRDCAKKHRCTVDDLPAVHADLAQKLRLITHQDDALGEMEAAVRQARAAFIALAEKLSAKRHKAAAKLAKAVNAELPALKLDKARFDVECRTTDDENHWGPAGIDRVRFLVATNPGAAPGPLDKIASGGELSRFMLALKLILSGGGSVPTLIFDEVDSGIGGAVADAVGERLQRLSLHCQVLVVTHSPQVAARAAHHWHVAKTEQKGTVVTRITSLTELTARQEEIARMLSGANITTEARAQAARLLENADKHVPAA